MRSLDTSAALMEPTAFRAALTLSTAERETLAGWLAALRRHVERADETAGSWNVQLNVHLGSALLGALHAIRDATAGLRSELLAEATGAVAPNFPRIGDAYPKGWML